MNHVITATVLLAALVAYGFGFSASSALLVVVGACLELWFWLRLVAQTRTKPEAPNQRT